MSSGLLISQFSTDDSFGSATIRYFSNGTVSHVDLVLPTGELLGARLKGGVLIRPANYHKFTYTKRLGVVVPDIEAAYEFALKQVSKPYNWKAILDMSLHRSRPFTPNQSSWFCDELNYCIYMAGGVRLLDIDNPLNLTPYEEMLSPLFIGA